MDAGLACELVLRCAVASWDVDSDERRGISVG